MVRRRVRQSRNRGLTAFPRAQAPVTLSSTLCRGQLSRGAESDGKGIPVLLPREDNDDGEEQDEKKLNINCSMSEPWSCTRPWVEHLPSLHILSH